ncbi:MAG: CDP-alcohol phosphatidyltransferase family protein [Chthoniobacterales bacterium]
MAAVRSSRLDSVSPYQLAATPNPSTSNGLIMAHSDLALKSAEIEELSDVYFFRPLGWVVAQGAKTIAITPAALTLIGGLVGIAGGALLYDQRLSFIGFAVLILHSILDSADGQLARITGQVTEMGRVLDGLSGYVTHAAIFLAIAAGLLHRGWDGSVFIWMLLAAAATAVHAGMYDYHRSTYTTIVNEGRIPAHASAKMPPLLSAAFRLYLVIQRWLVGLHADVETALAARASNNQIRNDDRVAYREHFYPLVRGWNFLGDNTRFYAIGALAFFHRLDLFFVFILVLMNTALVVLWVWQRVADRRFLAAV